VGAPKPPLTGGCICGQLRYALTDLPQIVLACHCRNCQQRSGSAFALSMLTRRGDFAVTAGESLSRDLPGGSGALHRQHVRPHCFTRTHTEMLAYPDIINVRPGTLDDPSFMKPVAQCWTRLARPWAVIEGVQAFPENPTDVEALAAEWRAGLAG